MPDGGRLLITGVDASGRSCVARDEVVALRGAPGLEGVGFAVQYASPGRPAIDTGGGRVADLVDLVVAPGALRWARIEYAPDAVVAMHHTDTVDFDVVLSGSVELILDDGAHQLAPGDSAVVTGVDHGWRAGPQGCRLSVLTIGAAPPS